MEKSTTDANDNQCYQGSNGDIAISRVFRDADTAQSRVRGDHRRGAGSGHRGDDRLRCPEQQEGWRVLTPQTD